MSITMDIHVILTEGGRQREGVRAHDGEGDVVCDTAVDDEGQDVLCQRVL